MNFYLRSKLPLRESRLNFCTQARLGAKNDPEYFIRRSNQLYYVPIQLALAEMGISSYFRLNDQYVSPSGRRYRDFYILMLI